MGNSLAGFKLQVHLPSRLDILNHLQTPTVPPTPHWRVPATLVKCHFGVSLLNVKSYALIPFAILFAAIGCAGTGAVDLAGNASDPFTAPAAARVFIFVRTDCPLTNRYAPELRRISDEFATQSVQFWLVYPDPSETPENIKRHMVDYSLPGHPLLDPHHDLVKRAHAVTAPEVAVFNSTNQLVYHGRIDDLWVTPGRARPMPTTHDLEDAIYTVLEGKSPRVAETRAIGCALADVAPASSK